jgi:RNA polymerase sigma factor (TIGR02999 family)
LTPDESSTDLPVSRILKRVSEGEVRAAEELLPLVYDELRRLAAARMKNEATEHTLQPTALVHEAYLRLLRSEPQSWDNRRHFFSAAAEAMRRILIEHARSRDRIKRGGELHREPLADIAISPSVDLSEIIAVHEVLEEFEREMPDKAELVKLRYFAGLDEAAAAETLGISRPTASRWWTFSRAWLFQKLSERKAGESNQ